MLSCFRPGESVEPGGLWRVCSDVVAVVPAIDPETASRLEKAQREREAAQKRFQECTKENLRLQGELDKARGNAASIETENKTLREQLNTTNKQIADARKEAEQSSELKRNRDTELARIQSQVDRRLLSREEKFLRAAFERFSTNGLLPVAKVHSALQEADSAPGADELAVRLRIFQVEEAVGLTFEQFKQIASRESKLEEWTRELPLAELVADGLSAVVDDNDPNPLRPLSKLTAAEVSLVTEGLVKRLEGMLWQRILLLQASLKTMDDKAAKVATDASLKFAVVKMSAGGIDDFHNGVEGRTGIRDLVFVKRLRMTEEADDPGG